MARKKRHVAETPESTTANWQGDPAATGAFLSTFTFRLPFFLAISDNFDQEFAWPPPYVDPHAQETFGREPFVRFRRFNAPIADRKFTPANVPAAVRQFYAQDYPIGDADAVDPHLFEQWVSLETPAALLHGEDSADGAFAFHRCLSALDMYLQAFALARNDDRIRPISTRELRPIVVIGRLGLDGTWSLQGPMLIHPNAKARSLGSRPATEHVERLNEALQVMLSGNPFVRSWQWKARAERRCYEGDNADAVVSFQAAAEVFLFEVWALLLADEGLPVQQIADRRHDTHFATLVKTELSQRLGGSWDTTRPKTPVGHYWREVYELRGRVVHAGYLPNDGDSERAERAFHGLEAFVDERLQKNSKRYPGTVGAWRQLADVTTPN